MGNSNLLLEVENLSVVSRHGENRITLVDNVSFTLAAGGFHGLVGESGSGKTMIANAIAGLLPEGLDAAGRIGLGGLNLLETGAVAARDIQNAHIGYVFQNPKAALNPRLTVGQQLRESLPRDVRRDEAAALKRALFLLDEVGIPMAYERLAAYPHELSGGLAQRIVIAMALARDPQILIADEPTTALDMTIQAQILDLISAIQSQRHFGVLLITHDMGIIYDRADEVTVLSQGRIVESGPKTKIFNMPSAPETRNLIEGALLDQALPPAEDAPATSGTVYSIRNMGKTFGAGTRAGTLLKALDDISLDIHRGRSLGIVGESGSGKSTLARILLGLETPDSGRIAYDGEDIATLSRERRKQWRHSIQFVFQDHWASLNPHHSIFESIAEPLRAEGMSRALRAERVFAVMRDVALPEQLAFRRPSQLSGGQLQRAAIARALAVHPKVLVADEPVASLDVTVQAKILQLLEDLKSEFGINYVIISHDLRIVKRISQDVIVMKDGAIVERGTTHDIFSNPQHAYTRKLLAATPGRQNV